MNEIPDNVFYVEPPTLAPGLTIHEYRVNRPRCRRRVMSWRFTRT